MTRRWLLVSLLGAIALAACAYALWPRGPTATPNPPPADPKLLAALQERTSLRAARMPLEQIVARLAESHGIRIDVDTAALAATLGPIDTRISVDLPEMRLQTMLTLLAEAVHEKLTAVIDGSRVLITTRQAAFNDPRRFIAHVYPIPVEFRRRPEFTEQGLATLITTCVEPMSWKLLGPAPYVSELPNAIVVTAAPQMHAQIKQLLAQLASLQSADPQPLTPIWLGDAASEDFDRIHAALRQRVSIDAHQQPLRALIKQLSDQHGVPICLELNRLRANGVDPDAPVTIRLQHVCLETALRSILEYFDLTAAQHGYVLMIVGYEDAGTATHARLYPIHDLLQVDSDVETLEAMITSGVASSTWDFIGGPGSIFACGDFFVVHQTVDVHHEIDWMLGGLRQSLGLPRPACQCIAPANERLERILTHPANLPTGEMTLTQLAEHVSRQYEIDVVIADKELEAVGLSRDTTVHVEPHEGTLDEALRCVLRELELDLSAWNERLTIRTVCDGHPSPVWRHYHVRHLVDPLLVPTVPVTGLPRFDELRELIMRHVSSYADWNEYGGAGSVVEFGGVLHVLQEPPLHPYVEAFLNAVETAATHPDRTAFVDAEPPSNVFPPEIEQALQTVLDFDFDGVPLGEVTRRLSERFDMEVRIDNTKPFDPPLDDKIVRGRLRHVTLARGLGWMVFNAGGGEWSIRDSQGRRWHPYDWIGTRVYPVADLVSDCPGETETGAQIIPLIYDCTDKLSWFEAGNGIVPPGGAITYFRLRNGMLVVTHNYWTHCAIDALLARLRQAAAAVSRLETSLPLWPNMERVERVLATNVTLHCDGEPLMDVLDRISRKHRVAIIPNYSLESALASDAPVTCRFDDVPLRNALKGLTADRGFELGVLARSQAVMVGDLEMQPHYWQWRMHDARHLQRDTAARQDTTERPAYTLHRLAGAVALSQHMPLEFAVDALSDYRGMLVGRASTPAHDDVEVFLRVLETHSQALPRPDPTIAFDDATTDALAALLGPDASQWERRYALYVLTIASQPPQRLLDRATEMFEQVEPAQQPGVYRLLCRILTTRRATVPPVIESFGRADVGLGEKQARQVLIHAAAIKGPDFAPWLGDIVRQAHAAHREICSALTSDEHDTFTLPVREVVVHLLEQLRRDPPQEEREILLKKLRQINYEKPLIGKLSREWLDSDDPEIRAMGARAAGVLKELNKP